MTDSSDAGRWTAIAEGSDMRGLVMARRRFVLPALGFALAWAALWVILAGWAPEALDGRIFGPFTVGYGLALTNFLFVWLLGGLYVRYAARKLDPLSAQVRDAASAPGHPTNAPGEPS